MPKGYLIAQIDVNDTETYAKYAAQTPGIVNQFGGRFLVRAGQWESFEGEDPGPRVVVIEFPSFERAQEYHHSDEYQAVVSLRQAASTGTVFIVEGAD